MLTLTKFDEIVKLYGEPNRYIKGGQDVMVTCPQCKNNCLSISLIDGRMNCFHCGFGKGKTVGGESTFSRVEKVDLVLQNQIIKRSLELSTLTSECKSYLHSRGIYNPEKYHIKTVPFQLSRSLKKDFTIHELLKSGLFHLSNGKVSSNGALAPERIMIPYWSGYKVYGMKSRSNPTCVDQARYANTTDSIISKYPFYYGEGRGDLIITEGELSALAGIESGFNVMSIPGITMLNKVSKKILETINEKSINKVFINIDSDPEYWNKRNLIEAALLGAKLFNATILFLPQKNKNKKMDLDSYLIENGPEELFKLMETYYTKKDMITAFWKGRLSKLPKYEETECND